MDRHRHVTSRHLLELDSSGDAGVPDRHRLSEHHASAHVVVGLALDTGHRQADDDRRPIRALADLGNGDGEAAVNGGNGGLEEAIPLPVSPAGGAVDVKDSR